MTSQPDKLFRDTLENFQRTAPAGAWDKIESNLATRNRSIMWLRLAAGIALLCAAAIVLWPSGEEKETITQVEDKIVTPETRVQEPVLKQEKNKETNTEQITVSQKKHTPSVAKAESPVQENILPVQDSVGVIIPHEHKELIAEVTVQSEASSEKIVYTAEEVNAKFLKKKLPTEATHGSQEASGIQKLIGLAYAAKNSEATLGDLRQKKDDILALNFGKNKMRTN